MISKNPNSCGFRGALRRLRRRWRQISLVDRCLMLFMLVLLLQTAFSMISEHTDPPEMRSFDIIMRTSSASIFGYFLSSNFGQERGEEEPEEEPPVLPPSSPKNALPEKPPAEAAPLSPVFPQNPLSVKLLADAAALFPVSPKSPLPVEQKEPPLVAEVPRANPVRYSVDPKARQLQIIIATSIGLFSLLIMLYMRYFGTMAPNSASSLSQFRDFVSGCVGFLIGSARGKPIGND